jgi:hypothetical protein
VVTQGERPASPFTPETFIVVGPTRDTTATRPRGPIYGSEKLSSDGLPLTDGKGRRVREIVGWKHPGKSPPCRDLSVRSDGFKWEDRYYAAGMAPAAKEELEAGFRRGLMFDPETRKFLSPAAAAKTAPTVASEALAWWRVHWSTVEPKSRKKTLRYISRPIRELVHAGAPAPAGIDEYLLLQMLLPKLLDEAIPDEHKAAAAWLREVSLPVYNVDAAI